MGQWDKCKIIDYLPQLVLAKNVHIFVFTILDIFLGDQNTWRNLSSKNVKPELITHTT